MFSSPEAAWIPPFAGKWQKPNILIIEDEEGPRESLKLILGSSFNIFTSGTGHEALKLLAQTPMDIITVDLNLPGTPGNQILADLNRLCPESEVIVISGSGTLQSAIDCIRHGVADFIPKPFGVVQVLESVHRILEKKTGEGNCSAREISLRQKPVDLLAYARVLASTLEGQDIYTHGHSERVVNYSLAMAEEMGFTTEECDELTIAAYLHDIGKIGIDRQIIRKNGPLTASEQIILRSHPQRGLKIVAPLELSSLARAVIRSHHECWDGTGYPDGLRGEEIHRAARIVSVADCFDAMTSHRPYRAAFPRNLAREELEKGRNQAFDPEVVEVFLRCLENIPEKSLNA